MADRKTSKTARTRKTPKGGASGRRSAGRVKRESHPDRAGAVPAHCAAWRIADWVGRFEVNFQSRPAGPHDRLREGPLTFLRLPAFGQIEPLALARQQQASILLAGGPEGVAAWAVFWRFCQFTAAGPPWRRGWLLCGDEPAEAAQLAVLVGIGLESLQPALERLEGLGWIERAAWPPLTRRNDQEAGASATDAESKPPPNDQDAAASEGPARARSDPKPPRTHAPRSARAQTGAPRERLCAQGQGQRQRQFQGQDQDQAQGPGSARSGTSGLTGSGVRSAAKNGNEAEPGSPSTKAKGKAKRKPTATPKAAPQGRPGPGPGRDGETQGQAPGRKGDPHNEAQSRPQTDATAGGDGIDDLSPPGPSDSGAKGASPPSRQATVPGVHRVAEGWACDAKTAAAIAGKDRWPEGVEPANASPAMMAQLLVVLLGLAGNPLEAKRNVAALTNVWRDHVSGLPKAIRSQIIAKACSRAKGIGRRIQAGHKNAPRNPAAVLTTQLKRWAREGRKAAGQNKKGTGQ